MYSVCIVSRALLLPSSTSPVVLVAEPRQRASGTCHPLANGEANGSGWGSLARGGEIPALMDARLGRKFGRNLYKRLLLVSLHKRVIWH